MTVRVQSEDFDTAAEVERLTAGCTDIGAVVTFTGLVRGGADGGPENGVERMILEHYPEMTAVQIEKIVDEACTRWKLQDALVIHRVGELRPGERIVLVVTLSAHRRDAYEASEFIIDWLKTKAPFWKREQSADGERWVEAKSDDDARAGRWDK